MMKIKIVSDGTSLGTKVLNAETGEALEGASRVDWSIEAGELGKAVVHFYPDLVDLESDASLVPVVVAEYDQEMSRSFQMPPDYEGRFYGIPIYMDRERMQMWGKNPIYQALLWMALRFHRYVAVSIWKQDAVHLTFLQIKKL
jgi:hypothetical protein